MKTIINIKADKEVKEKAQEVAANLGLSLSVVVNSYLKQFIRNEEVHISTAPRMSHDLEQLIGRVESDLRKKKNISPIFSSAAEMDAYLDRK